MAFLDFFITIVLFVGRIIQIRKMSTAGTASSLATRFLIAFPVLIIFTVLVQGLIANIGKLPASLEVIPISIIFLLLAITIQRNNHFLFLIPVHLNAVVITDQETGIVFFSKSYQEDEKADAILGSLFSALNISLQEAVRTDSNMTELIFGEKMAHLAPGDHITSLLITSQRNLMTQSISNWITQQFESRFRDHLQLLQAGMKVEKFEVFQKDIMKISGFFTG